jgi:phosphoribosylamine---glycine ligase
MPFTVLIIDQGARGHALSEAYEKSKNVDKIIVAPGNDFIGFKREKEIIVDKNCSLKDPGSLLELAIKYKPELIDVAQDDAIANGAVDLLQKHGFTVFGPKKEAARIEWDKAWARQFMAANGISIPEYQIFCSEKSSINYLKRLYELNPANALYIKASGLCSGKGAIKAIALDEAIAAVKDMGHFGESGKTFLIERCIDGDEASIFAISDGKDYRIFRPAQDYKKLLNNDEGPNTGGMGSVAPSQAATGLGKKIESEAIKPAFNGLKAGKIDYIGILYAGLIVSNNRLSVLEYNARWGDPEIQVILPGIETDYLQIVEACITGKLNQIEIKEDNKYRVCIVGASNGYPQEYETGKRITGMESTMAMHNVKVYGAGISVTSNRLYSAGGRLFSIVAEGDDIIEARKKALAAMTYINVGGSAPHYRTDIAEKECDGLSELRIKKALHENSLTKGRGSKRNN